MRKDHRFHRRAANDAAAQELLFDSKAHTQDITVSGTDKEISGFKYGAQDIPNYVGVAFYTPDKIDGATKYSVACIRKALFGVPAMSYQTKGDNIAFSAPTTTGEFLPDDSDEQLMILTGVCDTIAEADAWTTAVLQ